MVREGCGWMPESRDVTELVDEPVGGLGGVEVAVRALLVSRTAMAT